MGTAAVDILIGAGVRSLCKQSSVSID